MGSGKWTGLPFGLTVRVMEAISVTQSVATLLVGLLVLRTGTALLSHYFPNSAAAQAAHYIVG